jgi:preprotein translocase subunit SecD
MIYLERWKVWMILGICALGVLFAAPNLLGKQSLAWLQDNAPSFVPSKTVNLGLDLRGGSHLLLEVAVDNVIDEQLQGLVDQVRSELRGAKIGYTDLGLANGAVHFRLTDATQEDKARDIVHDIDRDLEIKRDDGGFTLRMTEAKIAEKKRAAMDQSIEIVRRRIDETGTREPSIQREGDNRILVQLPGVDDPERIKNLLGQTAKLTSCRRVRKRRARVGAGIHPAAGHRKTALRRNPGPVLRRAKTHHGVGRYARRCPAFLQQRRSRRQLPFRFHRRQAFRRGDAHEHGASFRDRSR